MICRPADALQRLQMLLRRVEVGAGLRVLHLRLVDELPRQRAFAEQLLAVVEQLLRGIERLRAQRPRRFAPWSSARAPTAAAVA